MKEIGFEGLTMHQAKHQLLLGEVTQYVERFNNDEPMFSMKLLNFLKDGLLNHI